MGPRELSKEVLGYCITEVMFQAAEVFVVVFMVVRTLRSVAVAKTSCRDQFLLYQPSWKPTINGGGNCDIFL